MLKLAAFGSELIDTQALTHLACLWYAVNDEADEENRALPVLSSDEQTISSVGLNNVIQE